MTTISLVYWGVYKFSSEDKRIPLPKFSAMLAVLILSSAWFFAAFADKNSDGSYAGGHGGWLGEIVGNGVLQALDKLPARSEEHTSELQSLKRNSYAVFCLKNKTTQIQLTALLTKSATKRKQERQI